MLAALIVTDTITQGRQMWPMRSAIGYKVVTYMIWKVLILILGLLLNWKTNRSTGEVSEPVAHILLSSVSTLCPSIGIGSDTLTHLEGLSLVPLKDSTVFFFISSSWCLSGFTCSGALALLYNKLFLIWINLVCFRSFLQPRHGYPSLSPVQGNTLNMFLV